ncbi:M15 family metallopeptidase [Arthrobacter sp. PsM3]|uniref:M15 family metallopeptidase n=1 Tax=Arthrobacter sp. PsM3 TaxID=3030531 RepID=UPI00263AC061|nr:M15 family metallopeptidase [Arthrobacter sp. PsM3]MDN4642694.1 M15 family metallopeptidase [Arthrobacter sp. PsM3]
MAPEPVLRTHGRRAFSRLLLAGSGLAALSACAPEAPRPVLPDPASASGSGSASATTAGAGTPSAVAGGTPSAESLPASPDATTPETAPPSPAPSAAAVRQHSLTDPASPWVVVNKHRPLSPATYRPADLVQPGVRLATSGEAALLNSTTAAAAERMFAAAAGAGVILTLASGYRSYATQTGTYNGYVSSRGQAEADTASARPGYSEHQTGWSFDLGDGGGACSFQPCFAEQPAAVWARNNAYLFGFVVRYPWMLHTITGYYYEPWHLRYIGVEAAGDMSTRSIATLEEYFGLEAAPAYL